MNDEELADAVVALGVGDSDHDSGISEYDAPIPGDTPLTADEFVRDWRVAGALMEKCLVSRVDLELHLQSNYFEAPGFWIKGIVMDLSDTRERESDGRESLPRAIIEACVEALTDDH